MRKSQPALAFDFPGFELRLDGQAKAALDAQRAALITAQQVPPHSERPISPFDWHGKPASEVEELPSTIHSNRLQAPMFYALTP